MSDELLKLTVQTMSPASCYFLLGSYSVTFEHDKHYCGLPKENEELKTTSVINLINYKST